SAKDYLADRPLHVSLLQRHLDLVAKRQIVTLSLATRPIAIAARRERAKREDSFRLRIQHPGLILVARGGRPHTLGRDLKGIGSPAQSIGAVEEHGRGAWSRACSASPWPAQFTPAQNKDATRYQY